MQIFDETLDPSETKDFAFDWSPQLGDGETVASQTVAFIAASGSSNPSNSLVSPISRVWLTGGTVGSRIVFTITAVTSGGRTLEAALGVDVVDSTSEPSEADALRAELAQVRAGRTALMTGGVVQKVRNGRYATEIWYATATLAEYDRMILTLEREIAAADAVASGSTRRRPVGVVWN